MIWAGASPLHHPDHPVTGRLVDLDGQRFYEIAGYDAMPPFLMTVTSDSDHWMFVSSAGGLTCGRRDPDHALFPYTTDDRLHDSAGQAGPLTVLRVGSRQLWEPFSSRHEGVHRTSRCLYKSVPGNRLRFDEVNHDLGLTISHEWMNGERFGFIRRSTLRNDGQVPVSVDVLDGLVNVLPAGLGRRFQMEYSTLADGYKDSELDPVGLGLFRLSSIPVDAPEPSEALLATTVWSTGLPASAFLLSTEQVARFRRGRAVTSEPRITGRRGAFLTVGTLDLAPGSRHRWYTVAELDQDASAVVALGQRLRAGSKLAATLEEDVARGTRNLVRLVATADGLQTTGDELACARHFSNVLFNCMRGGVPDDGYQLERDDVAAFVATANRAVFARQRAFLSSLPERLSQASLLAAAGAQDDPDLDRLAHEYLPLTFARRHGDPSRPWNIFSVNVRDARGHRIRDYQGNWRDLFQNWEALAHSFPGFALSMIFKFADASTADGYNPYRVTRDGYEWEVHDPQDAWSYFGYWGDHQVIYLQKLLEVSARFAPAALPALLDRRLFTCADVPYRINSFEQILANPQDTIVFDHEAHRATMARARELGSEGKALLDRRGQPCRVTLAEKLLVMALAKLSNFVPGAGLWLTTQRPEWNDANNALVGHGASVVTVAALRRFFVFFRQLLLSGPATVELSAELSGPFSRILGALRGREPATSDGARRALLDEVARPWSEYRAHLYARGLSGATSTVLTGELGALCEAALPHLEHTLHANRRSDGLFHAYNLIKVTAGGVSIRRLPLMLEGQVAVLGSGLLDAAETADLLDALKKSALFRPDQQSYLLYPDHRLPGFLEKNVIPAEAVAGSSLLTAHLAAGDHRLVVRDAAGAVHFHPGFRNAALLARTLDEVGAGDQRQPILDLYEQVFDHQSFTGRSGTFYKYEGLGCIYWHMVGKLALAVQEARQAAAPITPAVRARLTAHYDEIRRASGGHQAPAIHGAIPTDPYSHTPAFAGAQQPGMTGQVKEDVIARLVEMGLTVEEGRVIFRPDLLAAGELLALPATFFSIALDGREVIHCLPVGSLGFTFCQVPVVVHRAGPPRMVIAAPDGTNRTLLGLSLDRETSAQIFQRTGAVVRLDVYSGLGPEKETTR